MTYSMDIHTHTYHIYNGWWFQTFIPAFVISYMCVLCLPIMQHDYWLHLCRVAVVKIARRTRRHHPRFWRVIFFRVLETTNLNYSGRPESRSMLAIQNRDFGSQRLVNHWPKLFLTEAIWMDFGRIWWVPVVPEKEYLRVPLGGILFWVFCWNCVQRNPAVVHGCSNLFREPNWWNSDRSHRIHVCYIWWHLPSIYPKC